MSLIVTLTSTSTRLTVLRHTLMSLLDQSHKADRIVVCLSKEPYLIDDGVKELPDWFKRMTEQKQVEVNWVENIGPYRKLLPIYRQATDEDWIVTCDDDVIYGAGWLSSLVQSGKEHPKAIVCGRARRPVKNTFGRWQSYVNWPIVPEGSSGRDLLPIGIAGVLYRKPLLDESTMLDDRFKVLAPKQDDLWFNFARQVAGSNVFVSTGTEQHVFPIEAPGALSATNAVVGVSGWDNFFRAISDRVVLKLKGYLGLPVCGNDVAIRKLSRL